MSDELYYIPMDGDPHHVLSPDIGGATVAWSVVPLPLPAGGFREVIALKVRTATGIVIPTSVFRLLWCLAAVEFGRRDPLALPRFEWIAGHATGVLHNAVRHGVAYRYYTAVPDGIAQVAPGLVACRSAVEALVTVAVLRLGGTAIGVPLPVDDADGVDVLIAGAETVTP